VKNFVSFSGRLIEIYFAQMTNRLVNESKLSKMKKLSSFLILVCCSCYSLNSIAQQKGSASKIVTAKFTNVSIGFEGENTLIFTKVDGTKIEFCRDFMNPKEPDIDFNFLNKDSNGPNKALIGTLFIITYNINKGGDTNYETEKSSPCNQILSVKKKTSNP